MPEKETSNFHLFLKSPVITTLIAGLLTGFLGPYLLEKSKQSAIDEDQSKRQHQEIVAKQLEVLDHANLVLWDFRASAEFLMFDFINGQPDLDTLQEHLDDYEKTSRRANADLGATATKASFYFPESDSRNQLYIIFRQLFAVDSKIYIQLDQQDRRPDNRTDASDKAWADIQKEMEDVTKDIRAMLTRLSTHVGSLPQSTDE